LYVIISQALFADLHKWLNNVVGATFLFPERNIRVADFRAFSQNSTISSVDNLVFKVDKNSLHWTIWSMKKLLTKPICGNGTIFTPIHSQSTPASKVNLQAPSPTPIVDLNPST
jgi:hypothetical protein